MRDRKRTGPKVTDIDQITGAGYNRLGPTGKGIYRARCKDLLERGELYFTDLDELAIYADLWEFVWETRRELKEQGKRLEFFDRMGNKRWYANPTAKMWRDAYNDLSAIGAHFGFQPISRKRLALTLDEAEDPVDALLRIAGNDRKRAHRDN